MLQNAETRAGTGNNCERRQFHANTDGDFIHPFFFPVREYLIKLDIQIPLFCLNSIELFLCKKCTIQQPDLTLALSPYNRTILPFLVQFWGRHSSFTLWTPTASLDY